MTASGGGYFYDEVLEYRVWVHPADGDDHFYAFATYDEAKTYSDTRDDAEAPLVLVRQFEHVDEPEPGRFVHVTEERIAEWQTEWLAEGKRESDSIQIFLESDQAT